jgi:hypothetical protein
MSPTDANGTDDASYGPSDVDCWRLRSAYQLLYTKRRRSEQHCHANDAF